MMLENCRKCGDSAIVSSLFGSPSAEDDFNILKQQLFNGKCTRKVHKHQQEFYNVTVSLSPSPCLCVGIPEANCHLSVWPVQTRRTNKQ